jgi:hypothetical protein
VARTAELIVARNDLKDLPRLAGVLEAVSRRLDAERERADGTRFLFRNFDNAAPWMTKECPFYGIQRVFHSPLAAVAVGRARQPTRG